MRKLGKVTVLSLFMIGFVGIVFANGNAEQPASSSSKDSGKTYTITFNEPFTRPHTLAEAAYKFKELVEQKSNGNITVNVFEGGVLGTSREALEAVQVGTQTMVDAATAPIVAFDPAFGVLNLPYLFSNREQWYKVLDGALGSDLLKRLEPVGFVGLAYLENGVRHVTNNTRPITKWEDLKGIKIRLMQNQVFIDTFENFGCLTTTTPFSELYSALQQKVVDGQENPVSNIENAKLNEVQKYLSLTGHTYDPNIYFINKTFFDALPADYQTIIRDSAKETAQWQRKAAQDAEAGIIEELGKSMKINEVSSAEIARFREKCSSVYEKQTSVIGADIMKAWTEAVK
jgi:tripartite ATP-independent transporter DctP family solute receptor